MDTPSAPHAWLDEPITLYFPAEAGAPAAAYIQFRTGKCHRTEQADPDYVVYLCLGADDLPIGVRMFEPIPGTVRSQIIYRLLSGPDGGPVGVDRRVRHTFTPNVPIELVASTIRELGKACGTLSPLTSQMGSPQSASLGDP